MRKALQVSREGASRIVILTAKRAIKIPNILGGWRPFLSGLLANSQEIEFGILGWNGLCPVTGYVPGGWLVVMPKARILTPGEFSSMSLRDLEHVPLRVERKWNSYGYLNGNLVAVDYGN